MSAAFARTPPQAGSEPAPAGPREMFAIACRHRWKIAAALIAPPLVALALVLILPKTYRAQSDVLVKTGREYMAQGNLESANLTAPTSTKQEGINSEIALLTSRAVAEAAINEIGLAELYPEIVADPPSSGSVMDAAILRFGRDLSVEPVKLSNVISTSFDAASPAQARRVLDTVIRAYIDKHTQVFAGRRADGYRDSIDTTMREIRALEQQRSTLKLENGIFDVDTQRKALIHQRGEAETRLEEAIGRQVKLKARVTYLKEAAKQVPATVVVAATEQSDARTHAAESLIDLQQQEAALQARFGNANPDLRRVRSQIEAIRHVATSARRERNVTTAPSQLRLQMDQEAMSAGAELATVSTDIDRLADFVTVLGATLARLEGADLQLRDIVLQIDSLTQNLRAMQGRYEQARADEQTDIARQVSVVQVAGALASEKPVGPRKLLFGAGGLLGGVLLAGIVALLAIGTSRTAVTGEAAERRVGLPVLAVVPFNGEAKQAWGAR